MGACRLARPRSAGSNRLLLLALLRGSASRGLDYSDRTGNLWSGLLDIGGPGSQPRRTAAGPQSNARGRFGRAARLALACRGGDGRAAIPRTRIIDVLE